MASLQIEGDIDGLREIQLQFIRDVLHKRGFENKKVVFEPASKAGDNYVANVKRIKVIDEEGECFKMVGKFAPENEGLRATMNTFILFNNESMMYEQILPKLVRLQKAADVPEEDILRYAECYGCLTEEPNEVILLEDLKELDFGMMDRLSFLNDAAVRLVLKNFAILHSLSYAFKKIEPDTYDRFKSKLVDMWGLQTGTEEFKSYLIPLEEETTMLVGDNYKSALKGVITKTPDFQAKIIKAEKFSRNLVILQGDGWTNNILFKLENDTPTECIMIDYQLSREGSPASDILYMIFNCTDHATREKYYLEWMDYYHDQLDRSLSNFGIKANYVYSKDQLDADLKRYSKIFFGISIMLYSMLTRKPEEAKMMQDAMKENDMEKMETNASVNTLSEETVKLFKARIEDIVDSYRSLGYL